MKLISLEIKGFGSFAKTEKIDFEKMHGLWLISGDTGSGKTTIFDAITFALYGETSDEDRMSAKSSKGLRSDYLTDDEECWVKLVFEQNGTRWTVKRIPTWKKQSRKTEIPEAAELVGGNESYGKREAVNNRIAELTGITLAQFRQLVMIAQNDFEKLVTESSKDRQELLRKLLSTVNYAGFEERVNRRFLDSKKDRDNRLSMLNSEAEYFVWDEAARCAEAVAAYFARREAKNAEGAVGESLIAEMQAVIERSREGYAAAKETERQTGAQMEALIRKFEGEKALHDDFAKLAELSKAADAFREQEPAYSEKEKALLRRQQAFDVKPLFSAAETSRKELLDAQYNVQKAADDLKKAEAEFAAAAAARENVKGLRDRAEDLTVKIRGADESLKRFESGRVLARNASDAKRDYDACEARRKMLSDGVEKAKGRLQDLRQKASGINELTDRCNDTGNRMAKSSDRIMRLEKLCAGEAAYARGAADEEKLRLGSLKAHDDYDRAYRVYTGSCAGMLAAELREGCACPVCGSISHPAPFVFSGETIDRDTVDRLQEGEKKALAAYENCRAAREQLRNTLNERRADLEVAQGVSAEEALRQEKQVCSELAGAYEPLNEALRAARKCADDAADLEKRLANGEEELKKAENAFTEAAQKLGTAEGALKTHMESLPEMDEKALVDAMKQMEAERREVSGKADSMEKAFAEADKNLDVARNNAANAEKAAKTAIEKKNAAGNALALALVERSMGEEEALSIMPASQDELTLENNAIIMWKKDAANNRKNRDELAAKLDGLSDTDPAQRAAEVDALRAKAEELRNQNESLNLGISKNENVYRRTANAMKEWQKASSVFTFYSELNAVITGGRGKNENLETWIQRMYFARVIDQANARFTRLTAGMFRLELSEEGLDLNVYDASTGKVRPVNGLSGGEKFKAALSLALGMSEMIKAEVKNIELGMLFIDEGFGTLDADSISQAIDILEDLSGDQGRLVAVISHRQEMRQSISQKILVRKHRDSGREKGSYISVNPASAD